VLRVVNRFPTWQRHEQNVTNYGVRYASRFIKYCMCIRNVLNRPNKLLRLQYNEVLQQNLLSLFELDLREFGIGLKYDTFITVMPKCT